RRVDHAGSSFSGSLRLCHQAKQRRHRCHTACHLSGIASQNSSTLPPPRAADQFDSVAEVKGGGTLPNFALPTKNNVCTTNTRHWSFYRRPGCARSLVAKTPSEFSNPSSHRTAHARHLHLIVSRTPECQVGFARARMRIRGATDVRLCGHR